MLVQHERSLTRYGLGYPLPQNHFAVAVNNLEIFMEYLKSNDIYFESWDGNELQYNIRPHDNALQIYLTDPEGNWIEVNQRQ